MAIAARIRRVATRMSWSSSGLSPSRVPASWPPGLAMPAEHREGDLAGGVHRRHVGGSQVERRAWRVAVGQQAGLELRQRCGSESARLGQLPDARGTPRAPSFSSTSTLRSRAGSSRRPPGWSCGRGPARRPGGRRWRVRTCSAGSAPRRPWRRDGARPSPEALADRPFPVGQRGGVPVGNRLGDLDAPARSVTGGRQGLQRGLPRPAGAPQPQRIAGTVHPPVLGVRVDVHLLVGRAGSDRRLGGGGPARGDPPLHRAQVQGVELPLDLLIGPRGRPVPAHGGDRIETRSLDTPADAGMFT